MKAKLTALDETDDGPAPTVLPCTLDPPTQSLMKEVFSADVFSDALTSMEIGTLEVCVLSITCVVGDVDIFDENSLITRRVK